MNIIKFNDFIKINENLHDTPEEYVKMTLMKIKNKTIKILCIFKIMYCSNLLL